MRLLSPSAMATAVKRDLPSAGAGLAAILAATLVLAGLNWHAGQRIARYAAALAPLNLPAAARSVALQHEILQRPGYLPVYGSSELATGEANRPALFFQTHPSGFEVFPVGSAGDRCLIILQELVALADVMRGKRVVIFLSPTWFTPPAQPKDHSAHRQFDSRYSPLEAGRLTFGSALSPALRRAVAGRLLDYGSVLRQRSPLLALVLARTVDGFWLGAGFRTVLEPLGAGENLGLGLQDRWQMLQVIHRQPGLEPVSWRPAPATRPIDWAALLDAGESSASEQNNRLPADSPSGKPAAEADYVSRMEHGPEWTDFTLLLRVLKEVGADALVVDQPINGRLSDKSGVGTQARRIYYERVSRLAGEYGVPVADFSSHEEDPGFFSDAVHPSAKAWLYYNHTLDEFYHRPAG